MFRHAANLKKPFFIRISHHLLKAVPPDWAISILMLKLLPQVVLLLTLVLRMGKAQSWWPVAAGVASGTTIGKGKAPYDVIIQTLNASESLRRRVRGVVRRFSVKLSISSVLIAFLDGIVPYKKLLNTAARSFADLGALTG